MPGEMESMRDQLGRRQRPGSKGRTVRSIDTWCYGSCYLVRSCCVGPSREDMSTMRTVLQDDEGVFETETITSQVLYI